MNSKIALIAALALTAPPACAAPIVAGTTNAAPAVPAIQKTALHLGYSLQSLSERQRRYLEDVQGLASIGEGDATEKYIDALQEKSIALRKIEASVVALALDDLVKIEGPAKAQDSVGPLSKMLSAPAPSDKSRESKDKRVSAILATIDETRTVQGDLKNLQYSLAPALKLQGGEDALWALDLGRALAARRYGAPQKAAADAQAKDVAALLARAPKTIPGSVLSNVRALAPPAPTISPLTPGSGNLSGLLPGSAVPAPSPVARAAERALLAAYGAAEADAALGDVR